MTAKELYLYALDQAGLVVQHVEPKHLKRPTPDTEWNVLDLLRHITYELAWTADIVASHTVTEVDEKYEDELLSEDPARDWWRYEPTTRAAVIQCDLQAVAYLSYTNKSVGDYLLEAGNDQLVHAWDLGQAVDVPVQFDETVARVLYDQALLRREELAESGLFGVPVEVAPDDTTQAKLLGLLGRSEQWNATVR